MQSHGNAIERGSYDLIYTAPLTAIGSTDAKLETIFEQFNLYRPADYHSPSLSVSDIVAIKGIRCGRYFPAASDLRRQF